MLDRYLLRYFLAVVDQGNFSRAASHCNVSQPTLSVGISKLERTLGQQMFVRSNQRVELTDSGARFLTHARRIEREFNVVAEAMASARSHLPTFRLGVLSSIPGTLIARSVAKAGALQEQRLELIFGSERELVSHLAKGRIDVALTLTNRAADRFRERSVATEGYALALAATHRLAGENEISPESLAEEVMIVRRHCEALSDTSRFFTERGVRPHFALRSTNDERVLQMVAAGLGITIMPQSYRHEGVVRPGLAGFRAVRTLGWAASEQAEHFLVTPSSLMTEIANDLRNTVRQSDERV